MVDAAHEWGFQKYSDFEALSDQDKAIMLAYSRAIRLMRGVEQQEQARQATKNNRNNNRNRPRGRVRG